MINRMKMMKQLTKEKDDLEKLIRETSKSLEKAPKGCVRIMKHGKGLQFFHRKEPKDKTGEYIPVSDKERAYALIQKKYDEKLLLAAQKQYSSIQHFLKAYDPDGLKNVYKFAGEARKQFITAAELPDEEYIQKWEAVTYEGKSFSERTPEHFTEKGERVRSKSEVMIANALYHAGIPYRYEFPLIFGNQVIHPDFTVLRIADRQEVYWEHLGMMDDDSYKNDAFSRLIFYEKSGLFLGDRFVISVETYRQPLNLNSVNALIRHYFL